MTDFEQARINMVDCQIRPNDVTSHEVLEAFGSVPREAFVSPAQKPVAYIDDDLEISADPHQRYLMQATPMSRLVQLADVKQDSIVLDVGCGTGYSTAVLSRLCNSVVALECDEKLAEQATQNLQALNFDNAVVITCALEDGCAAEGPYDVIFVGGAVSSVPAKLTDQLKDGGRLVAVEGLGNSGVARLYKRQAGLVSGATKFNCALKPLPGFEQVEEFVF